jgi:lipopolysaccharide/colanic/teichoic acid biosynthesis glycosyltransferase
MKILFFQDEAEVLKRACLSHPFGTLFVKWVKEKAPFKEAQAYTLFPKEWLDANERLNDCTALSYETRDWEIHPSLVSPEAQEVYLLNGRSLFSIDENNLRQTLSSCFWDAALIRISPYLNTSREMLKLTPQNQVVGFRRFYKPTIEPAEPPACWPDIIVFKKKAWMKICENGRFPLDFQAFVECTRRLDVKTIHLKAGGHVVMFDKKNAFLSSLHAFQGELFTGNGNAVPPGCSFIGPIYKGRQVTIDPNVTLVGPVILSDGVHVKSGAVIRRSVLGENMTVEEGRLVNNQIWLTPEDGTDDPVAPSGSLFSSFKEYRKWSGFSYERFGKRIFDVVFSSFVLLLLIPVFPIVMLIVKLTSPGPVFYRARRQGLHGREFDCLKFRTMIMRADSIQERLRAINQVDGPQFKIDNDPRISGVGKFLRDTCIDELPQFINVWLGQMSIVGPRPSPESENDSCPVWRDARLSVRPGITGLWQVCRTRQSGADFQEWVYYDTQYVRKLSFRKDIWICWKTAQKLIRDFLGQFG